VKLRVLFAATAWLPAILLAGCASFAGIEPTAAQRTATQLGAVESSTQSPTRWPSDDWWAQFGDPQLNALVERALGGNPQLDTARTRLARAQAAVAGASSARLPSVDVQAQSTRQRFSENFLYPPPLAGNEDTSNLLQLAGTWEIDFFGRNRAALSAALSQQRAMAAEVQAARVLIATAVARTYMQLARLLEMRDVLAATLKQREQIVQLVQARVTSGLDTKVELRQAEGAVPEIRQQIEALDEQTALTRHALAALLGEGPAATETLAPRLAQTPMPALPAAIPAELVGRRADISAARWRVEAAAAEVERAKALFYPNVNLVAFAGFQSLGLSNWLEAGSRTWGVGPALSLPVFDAGRLRANLRAQTADVDATVLSYNATLIDAVRDVADQIASLQSLERQAPEQRAAQAAAESAYELATLRYRAGLGTYLTVLAAETGVLAQRRVGTELKARRVDAAIQLMRALGGGFDAFADAGSRAAVHGDAHSTAGEEVAVTASSGKQQ
jgi:NodT family efflux transporter outer membrane factor (OMF) lipoprotein